MEPNYTLPQQINDWTNQVFNGLGMQRMVPDTMDLVEEPILSLEEQQRRDREIAVREQMAQVGFEWHTPQNPDTASVGVRPEVNGDGIITNAQIAGRPAPKHNGSQGQHTTAFAATREAVAAAMIGRNEQQAREDMAFLFEKLLDLPAIARPVTPVPQKLQETIVRCANPKNTLNIGLDKLAVLYLEMRDALPGASLDSGIGGRSSLSERSNVTGKGEGTYLRALRTLEEGAMKQTLALKDIPTILNSLGALYDTSSEKHLPEELVSGQRVTYLMTIAQAFPELLNIPNVRDGLIDGVKSAMTPDDIVYATKQVEAIAGRLAGRNKLASRPMPGAFAASFKDGRIQFDSRPSSLKDGGAMGDHTCAMQLMKDSATGLLLSRGPETCNRDLLESLRLVQTVFDASSYPFAEEPEEGGDPTDEETVYRARLQKTKGNLVALQKLVSTLESCNGKELVDPDFVLEAAELYLELVDDRPTAVAYGGPAGSSGEPKVLAVVRRIENGQEKVPDNPDQLLQVVRGLLDPGPALYAFDLLGGDYLERLAGEFAFFVIHAYPVIGQKIMEIFGPRTLQADIVAYIRDLGAMSKHDKPSEEEKTMNLGPIEPFRMTLRQRTGRKKIVD